MANELSLSLSSSNNPRSKCLGRFSKDTRLIVLSCVMSILVYNLLFRGRAPFHSCEESIYLPVGHVSARSSGFLASSRKNLHHILKYFSCIRFLIRKGAIYGLQ